VGRHPFETTLNHTFADPSLLVRALTHRGARAAKAARDADTNERLEFLGDRVLGLVIAEALIKTFPNEDEGALAQRLAVLVNAPTCGRVARALDLAQYLIVAPGQVASDIEPGVLADACEAVIGALYLDGGLDVAARFIMSHWGPLLAAELEPPKDAKTALQEWAQARGLPLPVYKVVDESGPAHAPSFKMTAFVQGYPEITGEGRTKRLATQAAAETLLAQLPKDQA
jgi:ribonuclease-3